MSDMKKRWWILVAAIAVLAGACGIVWHTASKMPALTTIVASAEERESGSAPPGRILGEQVGYARVIGTDGAEGGVRLRSIQNVGTTCTITPLESHSYGGWSTNRFQVVTGGNTFTGYCAQPSRPTTNGTYPVSELKNDLIKFLLLCGQEGPLYNGYGKYIYNEADHNVYAYTHAAISYAYCGELTGLDANMGAGVAHMVEVARDAMTAASVQKLMKKYTAYVAYNDSQDIVWVVETGPGTGYLKAVKKDSYTDLTKGNTLYSLAGAVFSVYKDKNCTDKVGTLTSKADGTTDQIELEAGTYYVKEDKAPAGYVINTEPVKAVIEEDKTASVTISDAPQRAQIDVAAVKLDQETGESKPLGEAVLSDAHFLVEYFASGSAGEKATRSWTLKTDEDGRAPMDEAHLVEGDAFYKDEKGKIVLPLGTVRVSEVKAPKGYLLSNEKVTRQLSATENGKTEIIFETAKISDKVIRGDLKLNKILERSQERLAGVPFKITSKTTGESHIIVADGNGFVSTEASWNPHTYHTNEGKTDEDGVWFGEGTEPDDKLGALPFDTYEVEELECDANEGCKLVSFTVTIRREGKTVEGGTVSNKGGIQIGTTAYEARTGENEAEPNQEVTIVDVVDYQGLKPGQTYTLEGRLMDKTTGKPVEVDGKPVTSKAEFVPDKSDGVETVTFTLDARSLSGKETVVFEKLLNDQGKEIAAHEDLTSESQTVKFKGKEIVIPQVPAMNASVKTGDRFAQADYLLLLLISGMLLAARFLGRLREE